MPVEITAALIGVGGALLGSVITYFATMRAVHKAERLKAGSEGRDKAIEVMSDFLTEYTAMKIQEYPNEILELEHLLERLFKNLDMHGQHDVSREIQTQLVRMSSATAVTDCVLLHIEKKTMHLAMNREPRLAVTFVQYLLQRIIRDQDDLVDQLFNVSEKRLARVLLSMTHFGKKRVFDLPVPRLSQATLAEMVGTTRSRVSFFMNRFRKLGFISYDGPDDLRIRSSLLSVVQNDDN